MGVEYKDYYSILGVSRNASDKEIRSAYRKLARQYHPDVSAGNEEKFKEINEAYEALKDPEKRKLYDSLGSNWRQGQNFTPPPGYEGWQTVNMGDMGDLGGFSSFFDILFGQQGGMGGFSAQGFPGGGGGYEDLFGRGSSRHRGGGQQHRPSKESLHVEQEIYLDLEEVATGAKKEIVALSGKRLTVNIPKGVKKGGKIRLAGEGHSAYGSQGDLFLVVQYRKHPKFKLEEEGLIYEAPISLPDLVLGEEIAVPNLHGKTLHMRIPAGTQPGKLMRLKGQGLPQGNSEGDLYVRPKAIIPEHPSEREITLYKELKALHTPHHTQ